METPGDDPRTGYVKELLWAGLMVNAALALVGLLVGSHLGSLWLGLGLFLGGGLLITGVLAAVVAVNVVLAGLLERRSRKRRTDPE